MNTKLISFFFILVFSLSACSGGSEIQQNRQKWEEQNITHYRFTVVVSCFCPYAGVEVTYEVQNGKVVNQSVQPSSDRPIDEGQVTDFYQSYNTIEKVFDYLEQAQKEADETSIDYDLAYGFPREVSIDRIKGAVDDEIYLSLSNFEPLP